MTGKDIYDLAVHLLGVKNSDGTDNPDCDDFVSRAPAIINILLAETQRLDRSLRSDRNARMIPLSSLDDSLRCHELIAYGLLPFGLASLLIADEDYELSRSLYDRYLINLKDIKESVTAITHQISDCYSYRG